MLERAGGREVPLLSATPLRSSHSAFLLLLDPSDCIYVFGSVLNHCLYIMANLGTI